MRIYIRISIISGYEVLSLHFWLSILVFLHAHVYIIKHVYDEDGIFLGRNFKDYKIGR